MTRLLAFLILLGVIIIGLIDSLLKINKIKGQLKFTDEYLSKTTQYLSSKGSDIKSYTWLTMYSVKMQFMLGVYGFADYKPPGENYFLKNYQLIINTLPELRRTFGFDSLLTVTSLSNEYGNQLIEVLVRFIGLREESYKQAKRGIYNPFILFRNGIQKIISSPFYILSYLGFNDSRIMDVKGLQILIKIFTFFSSLIYLISSSITIILGWSEFKVIVHKIISLVFK